MSLYYYLPNQSSPWLKDKDQLWSCDCIVKETLWNRSEKVVFETITTMILSLDTLYCMWVLSFLRLNNLPSGYNHVMNIGHNIMSYWTLKYAWALSAWIGEIKLVIELYRRISVQIEMDIKLSGLGSSITWNSYIVSYQSLGFNALKCFSRFK